MQKFKISEKASLHFIVKNIRLPVATTNKDKHKNTNLLLKKQKNKVIIY